MGFRTAETASGEVCKLAFLLKSLVAVSHDCLLDIQCHLVCVDTVLIFSVNSEISILVMM